MQEKSRENRCLAEKTIVCVYEVQNSSRYNKQRRTYRKDKQVLTKFYVGFHGKLL